MEDLEQIYESNELFPIFASRILSASRLEYEAFLRWGGFTPGKPPDPMVILGVTEGLRQTDSIEVFPCPYPDPNGRYVNKFFLHGIRWMPAFAAERIQKLKRDDRLLVMADLSNAFDPFAVAVRTESEPALIGYVPRYLAQDVYRLLHGCPKDTVQMFVERLNADAPLQQRLLCRLEACWPNEFIPCADEAFHPIPQGCILEA